MKLNFTGISDPGLIRSNNQDAYYIDPEGRFFVVADGMGGHAGGEEASRIATREIQRYIAQNWQSSLESEKLLMQALWEANQAILQDQQTNPERGDMGTTVVAVIFRDSESPWCAHVGDSRLYRYRDSQLEQITEDHTWVARAIKMGDITAEEARIHPYRHVLSRCLGRADFSQIDVQPLDVKAGDRLLLCSDGLTEELEDQKVLQYLQDHPLVDKAALTKAALALVEGAKEQGGHDNITVVLVAIQESI